MVERGIVWVCVPVQGTIFCSRSFQKGTSSKFFFSSVCGFFMTLCPMSSSIKGWYDKFGFFG